MGRIPDHSPDTAHTSTLEMGSSYETTPHSAESQSESRVNLLNLYFLKDYLSDKNSLTEDVRSEVLDTLNRLSTTEITEVQGLRIVGSILDDIEDSLDTLEREPHLKEKVASSLIVFSRFLSKEDEIDTNTLNKLGKIHQITLRMGDSELQGQVLDQIINNADLTEVNFLIAKRSYLNPGGYPKVADKSKFLLNLYKKAYSRDEEQGQVILENLCLREGHAKDRDQFIFDLAEEISPGVRNLNSTLGGFLRSFESTIEIPPIRTLENLETFFNSIDRDNSGIDLLTRAAVVSDFLGEKIKITWLERYRPQMEKILTRLGFDKESSSKVLDIRMNERQLTARTKKTSDFFLFIDRFQPMIELFEQNNQAPLDLFQEYGIASFERTSIEDLITIWQDIGKSGESILIVESRHDHNGALRKVDVKKQLIEDAKRQKPKQNIVLLEVDGSFDLLRKIKNLQERAVKIKMLWLHGHANEEGRQTFSVNARRNNRPNVKMRLTNRDLGRFFLSDLFTGIRSAFDNNMLVFSSGCYSGLHQTHTISEAGYRSIGPKEQSTVSEIRIVRTTDGRIMLTDYSFSGFRDVTASIHGDVEGKEIPKTEET